MAKNTKRRMATARERLRRIEDTIKPYVQDLTPKGKIERQEWVPGDSIDWRKPGVRDQAPNTKVTETN